MVALLIYNLLLGNVYVQPRERFIINISRTPEFNNDNTNENNLDILYIMLEN